MMQFDLDLKGPAHARMTSLIEIYSKQPPFLEGC